MTINIECLLMSTLNCFLSTYPVCVGREGGKGQTFTPGTTQLVRFFESVWMIDSIRRVDGLQHPKILRVTSLS